MVCWCRPPCHMIAHDGSQVCGRKRGSESSCRIRSPYTSANRPPAAEIPVLVDASVVDIVGCRSTIQRTAPRVGRQPSQPRERLEIRPSVNNVGPLTDWSGCRPGSDAALKPMRRSVSVGGRHTASFSIASFRFPELVPWSCDIHRRSSDNLYS